MLFVNNLSSVNNFDAEKQIRSGFKNMYLVPCICVLLCLGGIAEEPGVGCLFRSLCRFSVFDFSCL